MAPSSLNCTALTATLSVALAETVIVPLTVAPFAGAVMLTIGGVVSPPNVVAVTGDVRVEWLPAASCAAIVYEYEVFGARPVSE